MMLEVGDRRARAGVHGSAASFDEIGGWSRRRLVLGLSEQTPQLVLRALELALEPGEPGKELSELTVRYKHLRPIGRERAAL